MSRTIISDSLKISAEEQISKLSKKVDFYITEYTIEILSMKMDNGEFQIPEYQRNFVWEEKRKSKFIESLLLGLPIPFLFFWQREDGQLEIVDGSQRLRTIQDFLHDKLTLTELESLSLCNGFKFSDLTIPRQLKLKNKSIRGILLSEHVDATTRYDLFERINTGSKVANPAEVRRGAFAGKFMSLIIELSKDPLFSKLAPLSKTALNERQNEELVARFFAYSDGLDDYKDNPRDFIFDYVQSKNKEFNQNPQLEKTYRRRFNKTMKTIDSIFPYGFRKKATDKTTRNTRFEALAIGTYLALKEENYSFSKSVDTSWAYIDKGEFSQICRSDGANAKKQLINRITYVKDKLLNN